MKKAFGTSLILSSLLFLAACPTRTSIGEISANPSRFEGKEVVVAGNVENSFGVSASIFKGASGGVYKLNDGTGDIWVLAKEGVPAKGAKVGVKGKIQTGITINGKNYGLALVEEDRKFKR